MQREGSGEENRRARQAGPSLPPILKHPRSTMTEVGVWYRRGCVESIRVRKRDNGEHIGSVHVDSVGGTGEV